MPIQQGRAAAAAIARIETRSSSLQRLEPKVRTIVRAVGRDGDRALIRYATMWDGLTPNQPLLVSQQEITEAAASASPEIRKALRVAAAKIRRFCKWQMPQGWRKKIEGSELGQLIRPLQSVGCYVPGGRYPLPSTLLMTVIPAQVAGVASDLCRFAAPATCDAGGRSSAWCERDLSLRRSAGGCRPCLRNQNHCSGAEDRRARK